jgi:DNA-binding transcriptional regulator YhcF (GntR family)
MTDTLDPDILYLRIAEGLASPIRSGTLARGERFPSVREMARQHGVAIGTVLQAYRSLEDAHLIEARPRSGYFVSAQRPLLPEPEASIYNDRERNDRAFFIR